MKSIIAIDNKSGIGHPELLEQFLSSLSLLSSIPLLFIYLFFRLAVTCLEEPYMPEDLPKPYLALELKVKEHAVHQVLLSFLFFSSLLSLLIFLF